MAEEGKKGSLIGSWIKAVMGGLLGLLSGAAAVYGTAVVDRVVKPNKPVANFAVNAEGLNVTCQNRATGESGWWDFGDGTPLEAFEPGQQSIVHQYAKAGNYNIKLIVRNFLMDENERSVPVDLTAPPQTLPPSITGLQIEPIGTRAVAPATFRIKGEVKNAERMIWDLGDNRLEVTTEPGPFERLVVFDKPGQYPISLIGHSGKTAVKQGATVSVGAAAAGNLSIVLSVRDVAIRQDRQTVLESVPLSPPAKSTRIVERIIPARPGFTIAEAKAGKFNTNTIKSVKLEPAADKLSVKIVAEFVSEGDAAIKASGGSAAIVPLILIEEKSSQISFPTATIAGQMTSSMGGGTVQLSLPPQPRSVTGLTRSISLDVREAGADGRPVVLASADSVKFPFNVQFTRATGRMTLSATQMGDQVQVRLMPATAR